MVVVLLLTGVGVWALLSRKSGEVTGPREFEPAQETTAAPPPASAPTSSAETSVAGVPETATTSGGAAGAPAQAQRQRVAFNLGERIYVSDLGGSNITPAGPAAEVYSLSPDGTKLAVTVAVGTQLPAGVSRDGRVAIIDVATQALIEVGSEVIGGAAAWSPDSQWVAYTAAIGDRLTVKRVSVDGSADAVLASPGVNARISRDGRFIAYKQSGQSDSDAPLWIMTLATSKTRVVPDSRGVLSWGWGGDGEVFYTRRGATMEDWSFWRHKAGGSSSRRVGTVSLEAPAYSLHDVTVSPDGAKVFAAAGGDDRYSRLWVIDLASGKFFAIQTRRDAYPCCWADSARILYFEGNTYQGEPSVLASILTDGTGRVPIVTGAYK